jgi:hypothetical protein
MLTHKVARNIVQKGALLALVVTVIITLPEAAYAAAKGKVKDSDPPGIQTPVPIRKVVLRPVGTLPFKLPNGTPVDIGADLDILFRTTVAESGVFQPLEKGETEDPCDTYIEMRANLSTMEFNVYQAGISFGYSPEGAIGGIGNVDGSVNVDVGVITMDFSLWECTQRECFAVAASHADHHSAKVTLKFTIDLKGIKISPDFVYNTEVGKMLRAIMKDGIKTIAASSHLNELNWQATVREVSPEIGMVIFDAGSQRGIKLNQGFVVYAAHPETGACNVYRALGYVKTTRVDTVSSVALLDTALDRQEIQVGDVVMIRSMIGK